MSKSDVGSVSSLCEGDEFILLLRIHLVGGLDGRAESSLSGYSEPKPFFEAKPQ